MKNYLDLLKKIKDEGTLKPASRENMPGTISLFGEQIKFNLSSGFPIITTKKISFKNIKNELIWFLRGDTNIKYLIDNNCNIWNEDAYNYYLKLIKQVDIIVKRTLTLNEFIQVIKNSKDTSELYYNSCSLIVCTESCTGYVIGDCGEQYGRLWRSYGDKEIDQLSELIDGLNKNPMSRRHIITAWNPETLDDMALNACHCLVQFNCRPLSFGKRFNQGNYKPYNIEGKVDYLEGKNYITQEQFESFHHNEMDKINIPKYYLDCQMYQRSADVFLGVPYNITSYSLLTHIIASIVDMIPGNYIHTFGDVHIYENHLEQVELQLSREPLKLPKLLFTEEYLRNLEGYKNDKDINEFVENILTDNFFLESYNYQPPIKGKLSTGLM